MCSPVPRLTCDLHARQYPFMHVSCSLTTLLAPVQKRIDFSKFSGKSASASTVRCIQTKNSRSEEEYRVRTKKHENNIRTSSLMNRFHY